MNKKQIFMASLLIAILSCGGGGGGGSGSAATPTNTTTTTTTTTPTTPTTTTTTSAYDSAGNIKWNDRTRSYNSNDPNNKSSVTQTGAGVSVGIIDTSFNTTDTTLKSNINSKFGSRLVNIGTTNVSGTRDSKGDIDWHGIAVAEMIGGNTSNGIAKGVTMYVADASVVSSGDIALQPTVSMYNNIYGRGVRIFNQSFGGDDGTRGYKKYNSSNFVSGIGTDIYNFYKKAVSEGALFIWAGGNESFNSPGLESALPIFDSSLEKGWLNVVGISTSTIASKFINDPNLGNIIWENLKVLTPAEGAKNWSVTAVADYKFDMDGGKYIATGSSFAAPVVTGTAALIKQKYPWMDGSLIRQTILSTATDIGVAGVDDKFGWGLLNIGKAINGPSLFSKSLALGSHVVANVTSGTYTFSNDISGDAGIIKNGTGTLILSGKSTFTGGTTVNAGQLRVNNKYVSSVSIMPLGTFTTAENATLENNIENNGTFENTSNTTTVKGNYIASPSSKFVSSLGSSIKVEGEVNLNNSTLELTNEVDGESVYITSKGVDSNVITSNSGITGNFGVIETKDMLKADVVSSEDSINANISRKNVEDYASEIGADEMQQNVAQNLETAFTELDNKIENNNDEEVVNFKNQAAKLQALVSTNSSAVLDSLSGQIYASAQALTFEQSQTINKDLTNRLTMLGTLDNVGDKFGLWVSMIGSNGKLRKDGYGIGKTNTYGGQVGIDKQFGDNLILGTALSFSKANVKFDRYGGESDATNLGLSLYGRLGNKQNPLYLQGRLGVGFVDSDVERDIMLNATDVSRAKINHNDKVLSTYVETGYDIKNANEDFVITPFVAISHDSVKRGSFSEENSQFGLTANSKTYNQTSGLVGLRVGKSINFASGTKTTLQGYATYQRAFNEEDLSFKASYTGLNGASFIVKGIGLQKDQTWLGIGALTEFNPNVAWYLNYDAKLGREKSYNNIFTTGVRISF